MKSLHKQRRMNQDDFDASFEKIKQHKKNKIGGNSNRDSEKFRHNERRIKEFNCLNCGAIVSTSREDSGVNNRNHCPQCLWSRHVDRDRPGDRKASCKSRMEPVGLTIKKTPKRYNDSQQGELMVIHACTGCGKISINRIAADDNAYVIYSLFMRSEQIDTRLKNRLTAEGILLLGVRDLTVVHSQLFGWQSLLLEFQPGKLLTEIPVEADD